MRISIAVCVVSACAAACSAEPRASGAGGANDALGAWRVGEPVKSGGLTVFPVFTTRPIEAPNVTTLDEAIAKGTCELREVENGGEVTVLEIENRGDVPVFVLGGEIVQGGKQDRVIAEEITLAARATRAVPVFCVEPDRWSPAVATGAPTAAGGASMGGPTPMPAGPSTPAGAYFVTAKAVAHPSLRIEAQVEKAQGKVWEEVSTANQAVGAGPATGTYTAFLGDPEGGGAASRAAESLERSLKGDDCVGFVSFAGDKPLGADVFSSPAMFARYRAKLLGASAAQTAIASSEAGTPTRAAAEEFLLAARRATPKSVTDAGGRRRVERASEHVAVLEFGTHETIEHLVALAK